MGGNRKIVGIRPETDKAKNQTGLDAPEIELDSTMEVDPEPARSYFESPWQENEGETALEAPGRSTGLTVASVICAILALCWTALLAWSQRASLFDGITLSEGRELIIQWSVPMILLSSVFLILLRSSAAEARRFGDTASLLRRESRLVEERMRTVNGELALARNLLETESREIETLGRTASEKITGYSERLAELVAESNERVRQIETVSTVALENMEKLRNHLPVIATSAKDVTSQIGNAGRTAHSHVSDMVDGFKRINEFAQACDRQVGALRGSVQSAIDQWGQLANEHEANQRLRTEQLTEFAAQARTSLQEDTDNQSLRLSAMMEDLGERCRSILDSLDDRRIEMTAEIEKFNETIAAVQDRNLAEMETRSSRMRLETETAARKSVDTLDGYLISLGEHGEKVGYQIDAIIDKVHGKQLKASEELDLRLGKTSERLKDLDRLRQAQDSGAAAQLEALQSRIAEIQQRLTAIDNEGGSKFAEMAFAVAALDEKAEALIARLTSNGQQVQDLSDSASSVFTQLYEQSDTLGETLTGNLTALSAALVDREKEVAALQNRLAVLTGKSQEFDMSLQSIGQQISTQVENLDRVSDDNSHYLVNALGEAERLTALLELSNDKIEAVQDLAGDDLAKKIDLLQERLGALVSETQQTMHRIVPEIASELGDESAKAMESQLRSRAAEMIGRLERSVDLALGSTREAASHLTEQLRKVDELATNLEKRVSYAKERAEQTVDNDFARRVALIIESLNSTSIDVAKILSAEIADSAWSSYLRGDRGVFTRRAVRILDSSENKEIAQHYENDDGFQEHVNRYIHDFEAMLRSLLSTRDGNVLGVTLLSSDMGKLYVALAQAIERLRN